MNKVKSLHKEFVSNLQKHRTTTDNKRNLILSILKSTTTKREARNYLYKYQSQFDEPDNNTNRRDKLSLRTTQHELYVNRFLTRSPKLFSSIYDQQGERVENIPLRIALFKFKFPAITPEEWSGISETLQRLVYLGISPVILLDYDHLPSQRSFKYNEMYMMNEVNAIMRKLQGKSTILRSLFKRSKENDISCAVEQILVPLYQGIMPIIQPIVYEPDSALQEFSNSNKLLHSLSEALLNHKKLLTIEKVIMIDPIGGLPSIERNQTSHVFINLSQEYADIASELYIGHIEPLVRDLHLHNLHAMNDILSTISEKLGNDDTTGIITTPNIMSINDDLMNPITYNVLTDRPIISSSLPPSNSRTPRLSTSILKKGMEVQVWDNEREQNLTLKGLFESGEVDREKLIAVINDSFGRELEVDKYFERINDNLATIIVLGDYDGAAIITYEGKERIPYLDKFAISKKNQGLPGLADIIFKIILLSHPNELIWRSRKNNPVNKWYFERCSGSVSNPELQWKIFYTGDIFDKKINKGKKRAPEILNIKEKLSQYLSIVEGIQGLFK